MRKPEMRIALIGRGKIARTLALELERDNPSRWEIVGALARPVATSKDFPAPVFQDAGAFFALRPDLIIEVAGPQALEAYGPKALEVADVWSISASALAQPNLLERLAASGRAHGRRLRFVAGAMGGFDAIAAHAAIGGRIEVGATWTEEDAADTEVFVGTMREAALRFKGINSLAAAAMAGAGLQETIVTFVEKSARSANRCLQVTAESIAGRFTATSVPSVDPERGPMIVVASLLAALKQQSEVVWFG